jgi:hypothetical protein
LKNVSQENKTVWCSVIACLRTCLAYFQSWRLKAIYFSKTSLNLYQTIWRHITQTANPSLLFEASKYVLKFEVRTNKATTNILDVSISLWGCWVIDIPLAMPRISRNASNRLSARSNRGSFLHNLLYLLFRDDRCTKPVTLHTAVLKFSHVTATQYTVQHETITPSTKNEKMNSFFQTIIYIFNVLFGLETASVVWRSEFLATDPEIRVRFSALPDFLWSSWSGRGFTQPREYNWGATFLWSHFICNLY